MSSSLDSVILVKQAVMAKKTVKCSGCVAAVKMEVCVEKAEEADAKCRQYEIEAKMKKNEGCSERTYGQNC